MYKFGLLERVHAPQFWHQVARLSIGSTPIISAGHRIRNYSLDYVQISSTVCAAEPTSVEPRVRDTCLGCLGCSRRQRGTWIWE